MRQEFIQHQTFVIYSRSYDTLFINTNIKVISITPPLDPT
jgi:hypothetical protein